MISLSSLLTGALKLVGEAFPWQADSHFVYTQDNHNSVLGIRELALDDGAAANCVEISPSKGMSHPSVAVAAYVNTAVRAAAF